MSICNYIDLGSYASCVAVDLEIDGETEVLNPVTRFQCTFQSGAVGLLDPGTYIAENGSETYIFTIV